MDFPFLLLVLLALPMLAAGIIVAVSVGRRRGRGGPGVGCGTEPAHRLQAGTAAVQDATLHPAAAGPRRTSARERRAASGARRDRH